MVIILIACSNPSHAQSELRRKKRKIGVATGKKPKPVYKNLENPTVMFLEPYDGAARNGP